MSARTAVAAPVRGAGSPARGSGGSRPWSDMPPSSGDKSATSWRAARRDCDSDRSSRRFPGKRGSRYRAGAQAGIAAMSFSLDVGPEVDRHHQVAATDQVELREGHVADHVLDGEHHRITQEFADGKSIAVMEEEPIEPGGREIGRDARVDRSLHGRRRGGPVSARYRSRRSECCCSYGRDRAARSAPSPVSTLPRPWRSLAPRRGSSRRELRRTISGLIAFSSRRCQAS